MGPSDLQIGALWTEPEYRNRGLAKAALGHTLLRLQNERETLWYIVRRDNAPSVAVGRHYGFGGSLEGDRKPLLGIPILGVYRLADAKRPARDREVQKAGSEFVAVSETAGTWVTEEGARMAASRYAWAASLARGRDVLEVGCGSAQGGMLLSRVAKRFVAGDVSEELLARASPVVRNVSQLTQFSAERLPFRDASFDMAIVLEAVYYIGDTKAALSEIRRVLRVGGRVAIVSANPTRRGFIASPHSVQYFSPAQLAHLLGRCGFSEFQCWGAFPIKNGLGRGRFERPVEFSRRIANHLRLVPRTLEGRARLKGILYRKMMRLPEYFTNDSDTSSELERRPIEADWSQYKVIYFVAQRNDV
ncbi:MAG: methyltransferase domain-containing protein [Acidobacteriia bacterium]|nr:methyltransferase domain-containing protein [Terriglobia bacterium]